MILMPFVIIIIFINIITVVSVAVYSDYQE